MHNSPEIIRCRVEKFNSDGSYTVKNLNNPDNNIDPGHQAFIVSPLPFGSKGGGIHAAPANPKNTECVVIKIDSKYYILGFNQTETTTVQNNTHKTITLDAGEQIISHETGSHIRFTKHGMLSFFANIYSQMNLDPISQSLLVNLKNLVFNIYGGWLKWTHNLRKGTTNLKGEIHKNFDLSAIKGGLTTEKIKFDVGTLESNTHIADFSILQEPTSRTDYDVESNTKVGAQKDRTFFVWNIKDKKSKQEYKFDFDLNGILHFSNLQNDKSQKFEFKLDTNSKDEAINIKLNDTKAVLAVKHSGETNYNVNGTMNINIQPNGDTVYTTQANETISISGNLTNTISGDQTDNITGSLTIKVDGKVHLTSPDVTIDGGQVKIKGTVSPSGGGPFNAITHCRFTGEAHQGPLVSGT